PDASVWGPPHLNYSDTANGGESIATPCRVGHKEQLRYLVDRTLDKWGKITTLVPNAAVNPYHGPSAGIPDGAFDKIMETNVRSTFWLCHMVLPNMVERKSGSNVIN